VRNARESGEGGNPRDPGFEESLGLEQQQSDQGEAVGQGMGLGLSICYRIVQEYDGRISVRTEMGKFCEFALEFPAKG
jgi:signal transduction histidine kinase